MLPWRGHRLPKPVHGEEAYRLWAPRYPPHAHTPLMRIEERAVLDLIPDVSGRHTLDLGCGSGRYSRLLAERGAEGVVGCDRSMAMIQAARRVSPVAVRADLLRTPFASASFDLVVCGLALGDLADLASAVTEIARVLRPGGVAVWSDLHPDAARQGWRRTFEGSDGRSYTLPHHAHSLQSHRVACGAAGLDLEKALEVPADDGPHAGQPAALVVRAAKRV